MYVSPGGNDNWSGRLAKANKDHSDGPVASLAGARDAIRQLRKAGRLTPVRVQLAHGQYFITDPVVFTPQDSGTADAPIVFEAAPGAKPVIHGGRGIGNFKKRPDGTWYAQVPDVAAGKWCFEQLWVNGRRAVRAREPDKFYYYMRRKVTYGVDPLTGNAANLQSRAFGARAADVRPLLDVSKKQLRDVALIAYHSWATGLHRVASVDPQTSVVVTTGPGRWPFFRWGRSQRYHIENFRAALDEPGEWYLDREGTLYYKPRPGEDITTADVIAPVAEAFIRLRGESTPGRYVEHLTFRGLSFRFGQYVLPPEGHCDGQAAASIEGAIQAHGARHVVFEDSPTTASTTCIATTTTGAVVGGCTTTRDRATTSWKTTSSTTPRPAGTTSTTAGTTSSGTTSSWSPWMDRYSDRARRTTFLSTSRTTSSAGTTTARF